MPAIASATLVVTKLRSLRGSPRPHVVRICPTTPRLSLQLRQIGGGSEAGRTWDRIGLSFEGIMRRCSPNALLFRGVALSGRYAQIAGERDPFPPAEVGKRTRTSDGAHGRPSARSTRETPARGRPGVGDDVRTAPLDARCRPIGRRHADWAWTGLAIPHFCSPGTIDQHQREG